MFHAGMGAPEPNLDWLLSHPSKLPKQIRATAYSRARDHTDDEHVYKMTCGGNRIEAM